MAATAAHPTPRRLLLVALTVVPVLLAGCGDDSPGTASDAGDRTTTTAAVTPGEGGSGTVAETTTTEAADAGSGTPDGWPDALPLPTANSVMGEPLPGSLNFESSTPAATGGTTFRFRRGSGASDSTSVTGGGAWAIGLGLPCVKDDFSRAATGGPAASCSGTLPDGTAITVTAGFATGAYLDVTLG